MLDIELIENTQQNIEEHRLNICYTCPIYSIKYGGLCNNKLWLNVETGDISTTMKIGYKRGCGCLLESKVKNINASCPLEKW